MFDLIVNKIKNLHPNKLVRYGAPFESCQTCDKSDCGDCNTWYSYDFSYVNNEGYGSTVWAPTLTTVSRNFGLNSRGDDYLVTYLE